MPTKAFNLEKYLVLESTTVSNIRKTMIEIATYIYALILTHFYDNNFKDFK